MKQFLLDEEINLLAKKEEEANSQDGDLLNTMTYVNTLTECVANAPDKKSVTIGLFGEWGSGKSSIIRTFKDLIDKKYQEMGKKVKVITYDAWKYSNDSFRRMFLLQMQQDLGFEKTDLMNKFYLNSSEDAHIETNINWKELCFGAIVLAVVLLLTSYVGEFNDKHRIAINALIALGSLLLAIWRGLFKEVKVNIQRPHFFAPEQFEECFNEMCERAHTTSTIEQSYLKYIRGDKGESGIDRLIIVIDNVDRCSSDLAYELLTNIKNFLGNKYNTVFIIPVDDNALKKHVVGNKNVHKHEAEELLRKFFNVCICIKPFKREEMYDFADSLNQKYNLGFEPTTVSLVANEFATNPRRIIQMFNNLAVELETMPPEFAKANQVLICLLLIIREEYPSFYKSLQGDSFKLFRLDDLGKDETGILEFLKLNQAVVDTYARNVSNLEHVLSNSKVFDTIPEKVKKDFTEMSYSDETKNILTDYQIRKGLISYIENALKKAIDRQLWDTDVKNTMDRIMALNNAMPLTKEECLRLTGMIKEQKVFKEIAAKQKSLHSLIEFAAKTENIGVASVAASLVNYMYLNLGTEYEDKFDVWYACSVLNINRIKIINNVILAACKTDIRGLMSYDYGTKSTAVYADNIIDFVISKIKDDEVIAVMCLLFIASKITLKKKHLITCINAIDDLTPAFELNPQNTDAQIKRLTEMNQILSKTRHCIFDNEDKGCLTHFYEKFHKIIVHNVQQGYSPRKKSRSFIIDNIDNDSVIIELLNFFYEASHLTNATIVDVDTINSLIDKKKYNQTIIDVLVKLLEEGYPIEYYNESILAIADYGTKHLSLLDYILKVKKENGDYYVDDEETKQVLNRLLDLSLDKDNESKAEHVSAIQNLVKDPRCESVLTGIFLEKDKQWLLSLPEDLFGYAIKVFEEHLDEYREQQNVLTLLAEKSSKNVKKKLVSIVIAKINDEKERNNGFEILLSFNGLTRAEVKPLASSLDYIKDNNPELNEKVDECQKHLEMMTKTKLLDESIKKEKKEKTD